MASHDVVMLCTIVPYRFRYSRIKPKRFFTCDMSVTVWIHGLATALAASSCTVRIVIHSSDTHSNTNNSKTTGKNLVRTTGTSEEQDINL